MLFSHIYNPKKKKNILQLSPYITQNIFSSSKLINCELSSKSN